MSLFEAYPPKKEHYECDDCPLMNRSLDFMHYHQMRWGHSFSVVDGELDYDIAMDGSKV